MPSGVGGFLGVGERHVRLAWKDLQISDNGEKVVVNMNKDQLKALPAFKYASDTSSTRSTAPATRSGAPAQRAPAPAQQAPSPPQPQQPQQPR
jgi:hypothetical protein